MQQHPGGRFEDPLLESFQAPNPAGGLFQELAAGLSQVVGQGMQQQYGLVVAEGVAAGRGLVGRFSPVAAFRPWRGGKCGLEAVGDLADAGFCRASLTLEGPEILGRFGAAGQTRA